ncbi:MAG: hypothetical protein GX025_02065 [Clostridiales bacterium]|nr:hypothetical protein [Clostridiales bacterium]
MKKIIVSIPNALLAGGVVMYLKKNPDFKVYREDDPLGIEELCISSKADVVVAEVRERPPNTLDEWNIRVKAIEKKLPDCRAVYVVDENSSPELADQVALARSNRLIDAFVYGTVSGEYMTALIGSL